MVFDNIGTPISFVGTHSVDMLVTKSCMQISPAVGYHVSYKNSSVVMAFTEACEETMLAANSTSMSEIFVLVE